MDFTAAPVESPPVHSFPSLAKVAAVISRQYAVSHLMNNVGVSRSETLEEVNINQFASILELKDFLVFLKRINLFQLMESGKYPMRLFEHQPPHSQDLPQTTSRFTSLMAEAGSRIWGIADFKDDFERETVGFTFKIIPPLSNAEYGQNDVQDLSLSPLIAQN